jgi:mannan polymerase II complex MNN10 subunit
MLVRALKIPPAVLFLLVFLIFFGWQLSQGPSHEEGPVSMAPVPAEAPAERPAEKKTPRIAVVTFVTEERSYHHISLKSKDRSSNPLLLRAHCLKVALRANRTDLV